MKFLQSYFNQQDDTFPIRSDLRSCISINTIRATPFWPIRTVLLDQSNCEDLESICIRTDQ